MAGPILVTGGAGYIGSHTVLALAEAGYETIVVDNLSQGQARFVTAGKLIELDLADRAGLARIMAAYRPSGIIHFAAFSQVGESVEDPRLYFENNLQGGLNLFGLAVEARIPVVFSSTAAVYGRPDKTPIPEEHPARPINPYGRSKLFLEQVLAEYHRAYGLPYAALRYFNAAGADPEARIGESHDPESHLIPIVLQAALGLRERLVLFGDDYPTPDGTCVRDYIHVSDLAEAHLLALDRLRQEPDGLVLNLGLGRGYSVREVIRVGERVTGREIPVITAARRPGDPPVLIADPELAHKTLGWKPGFNQLEEIVGTAWQWLRKEVQR